MDPCCNVDHLLLLSLGAVQVVWVCDGQQIQAALLLKDTEDKLSSCCAVASFNAQVSLLLHDVQVNSQHNAL